MSTRTGVRRIAHVAAAVAVLAAIYAAVRLSMMFRGLEADIAVNLSGYLAAGVAVVAALTAWVLYGFAKPDRGS